MEPVTHLLTGACLARSGLNRRAAYTTAAMTIAAEFPDIDTLWSLKGPVSGFEHHRGITHTFIGLPFEAAFLLCFFVLLHRWRNHRSSRSDPSPARKGTTAPVRWGLLYGFLLIALLSHLLLDYTNNYGLRPFFPFNPHWYAGSIVFIFDPLLFAFLLGGLLLPSIFGLVGAEVGVRRKPFRGAGWARAALAGVLTLWALRGFEHHRAIALAQAQDLQLPTVSLTPSPVPPSDADETPLPTLPTPPPLGPRASLASPDPLSIFRWYTATDFGPAYRLGTADTNAGTLLSARILTKPAQSRSLMAAERSRLAKVYLDWSPMPWISMQDPAQNAGDNADEVTVSFQDLRFMGSGPMVLQGRRTPLTGSVVLSPSGEILREGMDGRLGR